jgi:hypothetical protein
MQSPKCILMVALLAWSVGGRCGAADEADVVSLAGPWGFRLDPKGEGISAGWFREPLPQRIRLPGSTDEAGFGTPNKRTPNV